MQVFTRLFDEYEAGFLLKRCGNTLYKTSNRVLGALGSDAIEEGRDRIATS